MCLVRMLLPEQEVDRMMRRGGHVVKDVCQVAVAQEGYVHVRRRLGTHVAGGRRWLR
jgi:hypothetical protein